jgi:hypothetical protein
MAQTLACYLMTSPLALSSLGVYVAPVTTIATHTGLEPSDIAGLWPSLAETALWDAPREVVWVRELARYRLNVVAPLATTDPRLPALHAAWAEAPLSPVLPHVWDRYADLLHLPVRTYPEVWPDPAVPRAATVTRTVRAPQRHAGPLAAFRGRRTRVPWELHLEFDERVGFAKVDLMAWYLAVDTEVSTTQEPIAGSWSRFWWAKFRRDLEPVLTPIRSIRDEWRAQEREATARHAGRTHGWRTRT